MKVLLQLPVDVAREIKSRAEAASRPGAKVSQGDVVAGAIRNMMAFGDGDGSEPARESIPVRNERRDGNIVRATAAVGARSLAVERVGRKPLLKPSAK